MINFIKGFVVGIFNIIPGLSGCALLVVFNLYDKCLYSISTFYEKPKEKVLFLLPIALGIVLGTYSFSNVILFLLNKYMIETYIVFTILILFTMPKLFKQAIYNSFKIYYIIPFIITFVIGISLLFLDINNLDYHINYNHLGITNCFLIGIILCVSTIIPGISSTVLLSLFGLYKIYIYSISTFNLFVLIPVFISFVITTFFISKLITYLLEKYYVYTYFAILGFCLSTSFCFLKVIL